MTHVLDDTIKDVITSYESTEKAITEDGSDEYLDLILSVKGHLDSAIEATIKCTNEIEARFNTIDKDEAKAILVDLMPCFRIAHQIMSLVKSSIVYKGVKTTVSNFAMEIEELKEFVSDLSRYKIQDNGDLINTIGKIDFNCA